MDNNDQRRRSHLSFLQRRHAAAQHGATVAADLQEDVFVVPGPGPLLAWLQYRGQRGAVDDEAEIQAVDRQAVTKDATDQLTAIKAAAGVLSLL